MAGLISHLAQRIFAPGLGVQPLVHNAFEGLDPVTPELELADSIEASAAMQPSDGPDAPEPQHKHEQARAAVEPAPPLAAHATAPAELAPATPTPPLAAAREATVTHRHASPAQRVSDPALHHSSLQAHPSPRLARTSRSAARRSPQQRVDAMVQAIRALSPAPSSKQLAPLQPLAASPRALSAEPAATPSTRRAEPEARSGQLVHAPAAQQLPSAVVRSREPVRSMRAPLRPMPLHEPVHVQVASRPQTSSATISQPTVEISIGRVEIRATSTTQRTARRTAEKKLDLASYLEHRSAAKR